ncbi:MAG: FIST C-terminal domain-containing protein [Treponema sp.]|jgi:hypothetical protein|nr:FIST C-terminal domain-containing protein [Treponema sp.]
MIKAIIAHTIETTDLDYALDELNGQIKDQGPLLRNVTGIIFCNYEFVESGLVRELCACLPFTVLGCSSQIFAVPDAGEEVMLTLMVLTSDDVEFYAGVSEPLVTGKGSILEDLYRGLTMQGAFVPSLMLIFPPMLSGITGNTLVSILDRVSGGVPIFGSMAIDITTALRSPVTLFNGSSYPDRLVMVLLKGDVHPRFLACSLPGEPRFSHKFTITRVQANRIISINNRPAAEFLEKLGVINTGEVEVFYAFPIVVDYGDGSQSRVFTISKIDADGSLISEQDIPEGGTVNIGTLNGDLVIASTQHIIEQIKEIPEPSVLLLVSCFSRILTLRDSLEEVNLVIKQLRDWPLPFVFFSSGGEICPILQDGQDKPINSFHQFTIVACVF